MALASDPRSLDKQVPLIDIEPFMEGTREVKARVAHEVANACEHLGFLTIVGHTVPPRLGQTLRDVALEFFDLPLEERLRAKCLALDVPPGYAGYVPFSVNSLAQTLDEQAPPDLIERFIYRPEHKPMPWPERPAGFKSAFIQYIKAMEVLSLKLMHIFATALDLPETYFDHTVHSGLRALHAIHYPEQLEEPLPGQLRAGAHTDYGSFTILLVDDAPGGLQVQRGDGEWIDVKAPAGAFIVNLGDMMMRWTNDRWTSTLHRVVNPPRERAFGSRRLTLGYFNIPSADTLVSCIESCSGPGNPAKYLPITAGEFFRMKTTKGLVQEDH